MAGSKGHASRTFQPFRSLKFAKEEIILAFGSPKFVLSDNNLKFDCKKVEHFARDTKSMETYGYL